MAINFEYKAYRRPFGKRYLSASDQFSKREGILVKLEDEEGRLGFGEVAPLPSFGTENFPFALAKCEALKSEFEYEEASIRLSDSPCVRFAVESAHAMLLSADESFDLADPWPVAILVPDPGDTEGIDHFREQYFQSFKLKIGKASFEQEWQWISDLIDRLDGQAKIRLDANGSFTLNETRLWLERLVDLPIEFLEQPLPPGQEQEMLRFSADFPTPLALDESVTSVDDIKRWRDQQWPGIFVIKPLLAGGYYDLESELKQPSLEKHVFSSALETKVGVWAALRLASAASSERLPLGFGADWLFADKGIGFDVVPFLQNDLVPHTSDCEIVWNRI